jgi:hypothetical protein
MLIAIVGTPSAGKQTVLQYLIEKTWLHPSRLGITSRSNGGVEIGMSSLTVFTDIQLEPPMNSLSLSSTPATVCLFHVVLLMKVPIRGFCYTTHISRGFT